MGLAEESVLDRIGVVIQARMSSSRLPGKVMHRVRGKALLQYLIERVSRVPGVIDVVVATSEMESDTPIEIFCRRKEITCFRGPLKNVAKRFDLLIRDRRFSGVVRVCGDSPLLDQRLIAQGLDLFRNTRADLVTNTRRRTFPKGQSVEVMAADAFQKAYAAMSSREDLEHVTRFFYQYPSNFDIQSFECPEDHSHVQLSVDTRKDMEAFEEIVSRLDRPHWEYGYQEILKIKTEIDRGDKGSGQDRC